MYSDYFEVSLGEFNQEYFESLPDNRQIAAPTITSEKYYHTIFVDGERAGIVGLIPSQFMSDTGFAQIVLDHSYRGKGLIRKIYDKFVELHELKTLYATIEKANPASVRAHEKIGFKQISEEEMSKLRAKGLLKDYEIRLKKDF